LKNYDFLILGAGIFGITAAIELSRRKHRVGVLNPDQIPHPLAASTDISKVVRMEYGTDEEYMDMAIDSIEGWRAWNEVFDRPLFHETGYLVLASDVLEYDLESYAGASYINLLKRGYRPHRLDGQLLAAMFPAFTPEVYRDGFYHEVGGYVESGRVITELTKYARSMGIDVHEGQTAQELLISNSIINGVKTREGMQFDAGHVVVCAGNYTPYLLPELQHYMRVTGHPIFHLQPELTAPYTPPDFTVFAADIQNTGWYGFPYHPLAQVVKLANHGIGTIINPEKDERVVTADHEKALRDFLKISIPLLADAPLVYTRLCCYTDTLDGHFWIDQHPEIKHLTVASGGSGHAFKMGPVLGEMIADTAEGARHKWSARYGWRELSDDTVAEEEARFQG
jgi:glycine/D-amino acid oxidase-like deaminating enzyme